VQTLVSGGAGNKHTNQDPAVPRGIFGIWISASVNFN